MKSVLPGKRPIMKKRRSAAFFYGFVRMSGEAFPKKIESTPPKRRLRENDGCETSVTLLRAKRIYTDHGNHGENRDYKQSELYRKLLG